MAANALEERRLRSASRPSGSGLNATQTVPPLKHSVYHLRSIDPALQGAITGDGIAPITASKTQLHRLRVTLRHSLGPGERMVYFSMRGLLVTDVLFVGISTGLWVAVLTHLVLRILAY
jgi:hypothetical protein